MGGNPPPKRPMPLSGKQASLDEKIGMGGWFGVYAFGNNAEGLEVKSSAHNNHMNISKTFGNYEVSAKVEFDGLQTLEAAGRELASLGALYLFERSVSSNAEAKVFGFILGWELNKSGGRKRPAGFNRSSVPYSTSIADSLKLAFTTSVILPSSEMVKFHGVSVTENAGSSPADTKELLEFVKGFNALPLAKKIEVSVKLGIEDHDDADEVKQKCQAHIAKKKAELKASLASALA